MLLSLSLTRKHTTTNTWILQPILATVIAVIYGRIGDCIDEAEEMMMDSQASRLTLAQNRDQFMSYRSIEKDHIPCNRRGQSYYSNYGS